MDSALLFYFVDGLRTAINRDVLKTPKHYIKAFYITKHVEAVDRITADEIVFSEFQESNNTNPEYHDFEYADKIERFPCFEDVVSETLSDKSVTLESSLLAANMQDEINQTEEDDQVEFDARTSVQEKTKQAVSITSQDEIPDVSDIYAVELPDSSCNHEVVEDATVPFETKTESSTNRVMKLHRANIDVDTVEDFNVAAAITEVVEETNASNGSNVDWLI